jgi:hypothetical protein
MLRFGRPERVGFRGLGRYRRGGTGAANPVAMTGLEFLLTARAFEGERQNIPAAHLALGRRIVNREVVGGETADAPFTPGEQVYAHTAVAGHGDGFIEHVWLRDGVEVARHYMPVGHDRRWRTWSRHRLEAGAYTVEMFGPDGQRLAAKSFRVAHTSTPRR